MDAFRATIDRCLDLALATEAHVEASPELELLSPASLGVVCFRRRPPGIDDEETLERLNSALIAQVAESGEGMLSSTRLDGRYAIRLCILNHAATEADVVRILRFVAEAEPES